MGRAVLGQELASVQELPHIVPAPAQPFPRPAQPSPARCAAGVLQEQGQRIPTPPTLFSHYTMQCMAVMLIFFNYYTFKVQNIDVSQEA